MGQNEFTSKASKDNGMEKQLFDQLTKESKMEVNELKKLKAHFNKNYPNGKLSRTQFIVENLQLKGGRKEIWENIFDLIDNDSNKYIDFEEYIIFLSMLSPDKSTKDILTTTFKLCDLDDNGYLDKDEIGRITTVIAKQQNIQNNLLFKDIRCKSVKECSKKLFELMDENNDGKIYLKEFISVCLKSPEIREVITSPLNQLSILFQDKSFEKLQCGTFEDQVGGHGSTKKDQIKKTIIKKDDKIFKPLVKREFEFYEKMELVDGKNCPMSKEDMTTFKSFMPKYYGHQHVEFRKYFKDDPKSKSKGGLKKKMSYKKMSWKKKEGEKMGTSVVHYIVLQNLTYGMKKPCVIDAKMGTRGYDKKANVRKVIQQNLLTDVFTVSKKLGFRLCGMKVLKKNRDKDFFVSMNKFQAGKCSVLQVEDAFVSFVNNGKKLRTNLLKSAIPKLKKIEKLFQSQKAFHFYSSSILFYYDGEDENDELNVALIDFAHVDPAKTIDDGYLKGVRSLIKIFETVIKDQ